MRYLFVIIVFIHGLIHLLGFLKAYEFVQIDALNSPISRLKGLLWLIASASLVASSFLYLFKIDFWWVFALGAIILSQMLIIGVWQDARYGTIANVIILLIAVTAGAQWNFSRKAREKVETLLMQDVKSNAVFEKQQMDSLPQLNKWLEQVGATNISGNMYLKQSAKMKLKPDTKWLKTESEQWFTTDSPGFVWLANVGEGSFLSFSGRDSFINGKGQMLIKMYGLIPVVNAKDGAITEGTAVRFLAETIWFPWAARRNYIKWAALGDNKLKGTFTYNQLSVSGVFEFDSKGLPAKFEALRFNDQTGNKEKWVVELSSYQDFDGLLLPAEAEVSWHLLEGKFTWYKVKVEQIEILNNDDT